MVGKGRDQGGRVRAAGRFIRIKMVHGSTNPELHLQAMRKGKGSLLQHDQELQNNLMMARRSTRQVSAW